MFLQAILKDWSEYDARKQSEGRQATGFLTEQAWEVAYLTDRVIAANPALQNKETIEQAIYNCGRKISIPRQRRLFVQCVLKELGIL
jgi:hypothetical protein